MAAAAARNITPSSASRFGNNSSSSSSAASQSQSLAALTASVLRGSGSPRSPKAMSPRISPQPPLRSASSAMDKPAAVSGAASDPSAKTARSASSRLSHNLALVAKSGLLSEDGADAANAQLAGDTAPMLPPTDSPQLGDATGRSVVDPGLPGVSDTPSRAFTFPSPLTDEHTPTQRNLSLPNNMFPEKPYECQECNSRFRRLHDLKRHAKLHTGERPHECNRCGRKFARGDALARHAKGPGGCAGRRSSFIEEDPSGHGDESMDGVEYTAEPQDMDDLDNVDDDDDADADEGDDDVNGAEGSAAKRQRRGSYRPSTYPGINPAMPTMFAGAGVTPPSRQSTQFSTGSVAESPKAVTPGMVDRRRKVTGNVPSPLAQSTGVGASDSMAAIASTAAAAAAAVRGGDMDLVATLRRMEQKMLDSEQKIRDLEAEVKKVPELEAEVRRLKAANAGQV